MNFLVCLFPLMSFLEIRPHTACQADEAATFLAWHQSYKALTNNMNLSHTYPIQVILLSHIHRTPPGVKKYTSF